MDKTTKKIGVILVLIILVPSLFYSAYEITNLNENERVIEGIYTNQLDAILFSINQYSEDILTSWSNKLTASDFKEEDKKRIFAENPSLNSLFIADTSFNPISIITSSIPETALNGSRISGILRSHSGEIKKLISFSGEGYTKLQPIKLQETEMALVVFILTQNSQPVIGGLFFDQEEFIRRMLSPRIQSIAGDKFIIFVSRNADGNQVFATEQNVNAENVEELKPFWLLPQYSLGISLKGDTIESLAAERLYTNMILIILLNIILLFGVWLIFRNTKKEIQLAQIKSDFVANVSHELRTPLALVSIFAETLELGRVRTEEKKQEYYSIINQEIGRLSKIVSKILNFSKMEAGKRRYTLAENDLNDIVSKVFSTYKFHLQNNGFKSSLELYDNPLPLSVDQEAAGEAIINLIDNAIKYSQDKKFITIRTGHDNGNVFVEVEDNGIGIKPENQKKIFEKFFRVQSGLVHNTKGTGLGLSIVKHIMDAHKGQITLKSTPWIGSTFRLTFPSKIK